MRKRVLTVGLDASLSEERALVLDERYETVKAIPAEALMLLRREHFDLLLVCYTTPREVALDIIRTAHIEFPRLCIVHLRIMSQQIITIPTVHRLVTLNYGPDGWLHAVDSMLESADTDGLSSQHKVEPEFMDSRLAR